MKLLFRLFRSIILLIPPASIWIFFLVHYGDSVREIDNAYYLLLCPLTLYLLLFLTYFKPRPDYTAPQLVLHFRYGCLLFLILSFCDAGAAYINRSIYQWTIEHDSRYQVFIHDWLQKRRLQLPPTSGDTEPGPFLPFVKGKLIHSDVTADRWGFRREIPDRYADLSPEETCNVLCLGGSVMFGMTTEKGDLSAPDFLQQFFYEKKVLRPVRVYNAAFPGAHVGSISEPEQTAYWRIHPNIFIFYEAINWLAPGQKSFLQNRCSEGMSVWRNRQVRRNSVATVERYIPTDYAQKLEKFIRESKEHDSQVQIIFMTFALPFSETDSAATLSYWDWMQNGQGCARAAAILVRKHNECTRRIAQKYNLPLIDTLPALQGKADYFIDSCHLTQEGNRILAQLMAKAVLPLLDS